MSKADPIVRVNWEHSFDTVSDVVTHKGTVGIDLHMLQSGLIKEIGANRLGVLLVIVSMMDKSGKAFPSQRTIAELTGQSINTVNKLINELLEIEINGQRILRRELVGKGVRKQSMYYIHSGEITNIEKMEETEIMTEKAMNSKDYALYFCDLYAKQYGQGYAINYGRDLSLIKGKLIPNFDEETLKKIIQVAIRDYQDRWGNDKYPLPTIPMLASWLANNAYGVVAQEEKAEAKQAERLQVAEDQDESDMFLDMFGGDE